MKKIITVCLLSMALLLPSTTITAKEFSKNTKTSSLKRIVDVFVDGGVLSVTSDVSTGTLVWAKVYNTQKQLVRADYLSGYSDAMDVSGLKTGMYTVTVHTSLTNYSETVFIQ